jgi:hypothetical protein
MLPARRPPRHPDLPVPGRRQRQVLDTLAALSRIQGTRGATWSAAGVMLDPANTDVRFGQTPSGGIPARSGTTLGSGTITEAKIIHPAPSVATIVTSTTTFTAFNYSATAIPASKYCVCRIIFGVWVVISVEC